MICQPHLRLRLFRCQSRGQTASATVTVTGDSDLAAVATTSHGDSARGASRKWALALQVTDSAGPAAARRARRGRRHGLTQSFAG